MSDYDFYLKDASVASGEWVGFPLAWKGRGNIVGLPVSPYRRWYPWNLDPSNPNDPTRGSRGVLQWRFSVALVDGLVGLEGHPPDDGRTAGQIRQDLLLYMPLDQMDLRDIDGTEYTVKMTSYTEQALEPFDVAHPSGGILAEVEFAIVV